MKKDISQKTYFFPLVTSRTYSIRLTANPRAQIDSGDPGLSFGRLAILLANIVVEIVSIICENSPILRKFDLFLPPVTSNITWLALFCITCRGLSNAVYHLSLSFLVFEISGGGGAGGHPPPSGRVAQTRVNPETNGYWVLLGVSVVLWTFITLLTWLWALRFSVLSILAPEMIRIK